MTVALCCLSGIAMAIRSGASISNHSPLGPYQPELPRTGSKVAVVVALHEEWSPATNWKLQKPQAPNSDRSPLGETA